MPVGALGHDASAQRTGFWHTGDAAHATGDGSGLFLNNVFSVERPSAARPRCSVESTTNDAWWPMTSWPIVPGCQLMYLRARPNDSKRRKGDCRPWTASSKV